MGVFLLSSFVSRPELEAKIAEKFPRSRQWGDGTRSWILVGKGTAKDVSDALGIVPGSQNNGTLVVRLSADYYGLANAEFWGWLKESFESNVDG
jgi:hypothetical protein